MKKLFSLLTVCLCLSGPLMGVLPPLYTSSQEIQGLLQDPQLAQKLGSEQMIQSIKRTSTGFIITTQEKKIKVKVKTKPQSMPGPTKWIYEFKEVKELHE